MSGPFDSHRWAVVARLSLSGESLKIGLRRATARLRILELWVPASTTYRNGRASWQGLHRSRWSTTLTARWRRALSASLLMGKPTSWTCPTRTPRSFGTPWLLLLRPPVVSGAAAAAALVVRRCRPLGLTARRPRRFVNGPASTATRFLTVAGFPLRARGVRERRSLTRLKICSRRLRRPRPAAAWPPCRRSYVTASTARQRSPGTAKVAGASTARVASIGDDGREHIPQRAGGSMSNALPKQA